MLGDLGDGGGTPTSSMLDNDAPDKTVQNSRLLALQNYPIVSGLCSTTSSTCSSYKSGHVAHVALQVAGFKGRNLWKLWKKNRINHDKSTRCCWKPMGIVRFPAATSCAWRSIENLPGLMGRRPLHAHPCASTWARHSILVTIPQKTLGKKGNIEITRVPIITRS